MRHVFCLRKFQVAAAMLFAMIAAGCAPPLASQHSYFAMPRASVARIDAETQHRVTYHHALQVVRRACAQAVAVAQDTGPAASREALADTCATLNPRSVTWHGGVSGAYRRWVEDQVQELPKASDTAASAGGGS